jgi:hypothetical protein
VPFSTDWFQEGHQIKIFGEEESEIGSMAGFSERASWRLLIAQDFSGLNPPNPVPEWVYP